MTLFRLSNRSLVLICFLAGFLLTGVGCMVHLISPYDDVLDQEVTDLQKSTETFFNQIDVDGCPASASFSGNTDFYAKTNAALATLATRAASEPKAKVPIVSKQIQELSATYADIQGLHKLNKPQCLTSRNIADNRKTLEGEFNAIITLQMALKANDKAPKI